MMALTSFALIPALSSAICVAGYTAAAVPRDYFIKLQVGMLTHSDEFDPRYAAPYFLVVGERDGDEVRYYRTWKELFEKSFRVVAPDTKPSTGGADYGSSYEFIARAVLLLGIEAGIERAREALDVLERRLPRRKEVLSRDPTWALKP